MELTYKGTKIQIDWLWEGEPKKYSKKGWGIKGAIKITFGELMSLTGKVYKKENSTDIFIAYPSEYNTMKKKYFDNPYLPKELKDVLNSALNGNESVLEQQEETQETNKEEDIPWEIEL